MLGSSLRKACLTIQATQYTALSDTAAAKLTKIITSSAMRFLLQHLSSNAPAGSQTTNPTSIVLHAAHLSTLQTLTRTSATLRFFLYSPNSLITNHNLTSHTPMPAPLQRHVTFIGGADVGLLLKFARSAIRGHVTVEIFGVTTAARAWLY